MLHLSVEGGVATVTLDNAPVNALSGRMMKELKQLLGDMATVHNIKAMLRNRAPGSARKI